jgi:hypothetical protein
MSKDAIPAEVLELVNAQVEAFRERRIRIELAKYRESQRRRTVVAMAGKKLFKGDGFDGLRVRAANALKNQLARAYGAAEVDEIAAAGPRHVAQAVAKIWPFGPGGNFGAKSRAEVMEWLLAHGIEPGNRLYDRTKP